MVLPVRVAVSVADLRAKNAREAGRLAGQVDRELRLIHRATQILATTRLGPIRSPSSPGRREDRNGLS